MGLFDKLHKNKEIIIKSPINGEIKPIEEVEDVSFSEKLLGDGFMVAPTSTELYAPCDAKVTMIFPTKHAIGLQLKDGSEILIHFGLDTVELNGKGFETFVEVNQKVSSSTLLLKADLDYIKKNARSDSVIVVFTKLNEGVQLEFNYEGNTRGSEVVRFIKEG